MSGTFLVLFPEILPTTRVDLTFGLRSAMRYHREQSVPGIGGAWFVRQLSWAVAGFKLLKENTKESPIRVANAIEALACKSEYKMNPDEYSFRGKRAFARDWDNDIWDFNKLVQKRHYVQITYRQSTVRALPSNIGLGFVEGDGIRFNTMKLSPLGNLLAEAFLYQDGGIGKGNKAVAAFLAEWISGQARPGNNADPKSLSQRLGPSNPSKKEKEIVLRRLESFVTGGICSDDRERRLRILNYFKKFNSGSWDNLLDNFDTADKNAGIHANHLRNAKAFEEMRLRCAMLLDSCAIAMNEEELGITVKELSIKPKIKSALGDATISAEQYLTSLKKQGPYPQDAYTFASQMLGDSLEEKLRLILSRDGRILQIFDDKVTKGPLFKTGFSDLEMGDDESDSALPPEKESENFFLLNRLQQFYSLWLNCRGGSE